jgi:hypothetical protein
VKDIGNSFKIESFDCKDDPLLVYQNLKNYKFKKPRIINVQTNRLYWHSGAGIDNHDVFDRLNVEIKKLGKLGRDINLLAKKKIESLFI